MSVVNGQADVVVVGSGAAGLVAALAAARAGARVTLLEAQERWGGTTAISGGAVWVPANHLMAGEGVDDGFDDAYAYCRDHAPGRDPGLVAALLRAGPAMVRFVEEHTDIRFRIMDFPDTFAESPSGRARGRHLEVAPLDIGDIGPTADLVWTAPFPMVLTNDELYSGVVHGGTNIPVNVIGRRIAADEVTLGLGLVMGLLNGCERAGVEMVNRTRVTSVLRGRDGRAAGVLAERAGERVEYRARRAIVLAAGGYEHDHDRLPRFADTGPMTHPLSAPVGLGDGLRLAAEAGAEIAHSGECWCTAATPVAGRVWYDHAQTPRPFLVLAERFMPHVLWVDRHGRRFVNEAAHNGVLALAEVDPATHQPRHLPAWAICDAQYREAYVFAGLAPGGKIPEHVRMAESVEGLAELIEVEPAALKETIERFNGFARAGRDDDFGRGESAYDRYSGDARAPHPTLGTVERPPYFAVSIQRAPISTKGGPRIDERGRVLDWSGTAVPGLYAAGSNAASILGPGAVAHGMHLGTALTVGWLAGMDAAGGDPTAADGWLA